MMTKGGRFPKAIRISAFRYLRTLFAPLGVLAFVQEEKWLRILTLALGKLPLSGLKKGSAVNPAAWTVAGALIQAPPKALTLSQFYHAPLYPLLQSEGL